MAASRKCICKPPATSQKGSSACDADGTPGARLVTPAAGVPIGLRSDLRPVHHTEHGALC